VVSSRAFRLAAIPRFPATRAKREYWSIFELLQDDAAPEQVKRWLAEWCERRSDFELVVESEVQRRLQVIDRGLAIAGSDDERATLEQQRAMMLAGLEEFRVASKHNASSKAKTARNKKRQKNKRS
jgi:hypothetical protein